LASRYHLTLLVFAIPGPWDHPRSWSPRPRTIMSYFSPESHHTLPHYCGRDRQQWQEENG